MTDPKNLNKCCPTNDGNVGKAIHSLSNRIQYLERINSDIKNSIDDIQILLSDWNLSNSDAKDFIKNKPRTLDGKSAYELAVDNGFEGTEQEWLASLKGEDGQLGLEGPAGQDGAPGRDGINGLDGAPGQDGHTPIITATKSNGVTTIKSDGTTIATINDGTNGTNGLNGQDGAPGLDGHSPVVTASKSGSTTTIYVDGTSIATIEDGLDGQDGQNGINGTNGTNGLDGITPHIDSTSKHWMIGSTDTGIVAEGQNGSNGTNGSDGVTPHIDSTTGNWFIGTTDTGVHAQGPAGQDGNVANQLQADWNLSDNTQADYIKNKPTISTAPDLTNYVQKSSTSGLLKNDGTVDTSTYAEIQIVNANNHDYVDLALPSGTLWARYNVGATSETSAGNYYMWGKGSSQYNSSDSKYSGDSDTLSLSMDAASLVMGGSWHTPTKTLLDELVANTTCEWITINGVNGAKYTASNGNYIFLPAVGYYVSGSLDDDGIESVYLSSNRVDSESNFVYSLLCIHGVANVNSYSILIHGCPVRGVIDHEPNKLFKVAMTGDYNDLSNKPTIPTVPTNISSFTNDAGYLTSHQSLTDYVQKSLTSGLLKNDGTVDTNTYLTSHLSLTNYIQKSQTSGLIKNDGTIDTSIYLTSHLDISGKANSADLATVAISGSYADLSNKPTIPDALILSDWNQTDNTAKDYIKNKPTIPTIWRGTQAQYDLLTPDNNTIYIITSS